MRILHTADVHLKTAGDLSILQTIIRTAADKKCAAILIAGDLFDQQSAGLATEQAIPQIFQEFEGEILILPGNHDYEILQGKKSLSRNSMILNSREFIIRRKLDNAELAAVPFRKDLSMKDIGAIDCDPENSILLAHGNYYTNEFFYDDEVKKYFPIFDEDLRDNYRYVALGHYHRHFRYELGRTVVLNPGSPRITRASDTGPRMVSILDTSNWKDESVTLPVEYILPLEIYASVFDTPEILREKLKQKLQAIQNPKLARPSVVLRGTLSSEIEITSLQEMLSQTANQSIGKAAEIDTRELHLIDKNLTAHPFVKSLLAELDRTSNPEEKEDLKLFALERLNSIK